jgi:hypothetical protein
VTSSELASGAPAPRGILSDLAALGPFFCVHAHQPGERPQLPWLIASELTSDPELMQRRIAAVRQALAATAGCQAEQIERRVAASAAHFGLVARLLSPALAALAFGYELSTQLAELWWQDVLGGPCPLSVPLPAHRLDRCRQSTEKACRKLVSDVIAPVTATVAGQVPVSTRVLWGNVASAVSSASTQIAAAQPAAAGAARQLADLVFSSPQLQTERSQPGPGFRRSSCCLIYRLSAVRAEGTCTDCVLSDSPC